MNTFAQSYDCIITLITRKIYYNLLLENFLVLFEKKNKNKTWIPFTQGCFVPSFVIIGPAILEKEDLKKKLSMYFDISLLSPLCKGCCPSFWYTWIPFTQGCFVSNLIGPVVLENKVQNCEKLTDGRRSPGDQKRSLELKGALFLKKS